MILHLLFGKIILNSTNIWGIENDDNLGSSLVEKKQIKNNDREYFDGLSHADMPYYTHLPVGQ